MTHRWQGSRRAAIPPARRGTRRSLRLLLALAAAAGFFAYLMPLFDGALAPATAHPLDRSRATPLGRYLRADHDLTARRASLPDLVAAAAPEPVRLARPVLVERGRLDAPDASGWRPTPGHPPDLSRSPPGR
jgi:fermentation-respiration switch protein FrsA (DUF1100 family)